ncbi:MAG: ABC transporter permease [bacterium]
MWSFFLRRILYMFFLLLVLSVVSFVIIQLPPGDWLTTYIIQLQAQGTEVSEATIEALRHRYGLDMPPALQYFKWVWGMLRGDMGRSFQYNKEVSALIGERLGLTVAISLFTLVFTYLVAIPIGIYSATRQYSLGDYLFSAIGFIGLATPSFLLALILMFILNRLVGLSVGGLFSPQYLIAPWSIRKFLDMLAHLPLPIAIIGASGAAGLIRVMRGCLLDELRRQYVITARAKGLDERKLLFKYPVRAAINPIVSTIGWALPAIVSGETITAIVLGIPTTGPLLMQALLNQDMYLAGSFIMFLGALTILGTFLSDILLAVLDPRIRFEKKEV